jgi:hypothetical protein
MNTYFQRTRRGTVTPSPAFDDIGREASGNNRQTNLVTEKEKRVYFKGLRKLVGNYLPGKTLPLKKTEQNMQQPPIASQGTSRQTPYYTTADNNTYFQHVSKRDPVISRKRLEAVQKTRATQNIRILPNDVFSKILQYTTAHDKTVLDKVLLGLYITERKKSTTLSRVNRNEYATFLNNIVTVHLENVKINEVILEILNKTIEHSNISTIILRNVGFDNSPGICEHFIEYLSKNTKLKILILSDVKVTARSFNNFLRILENFKDLELLEFSNFDILKLFKVNNEVHFHYFFMKLIINLDTLNYLIFNNNTITHKDYTYLFNKLNDVNNYYVIDLGRDGIYLKYNDNKDEEDDNQIKLGEQFMHIIEIDTAARKSLNRCADRYYIDFHTHGNKDAFNKNLTSFHHKYISHDAKFVFNQYNVPAYLFKTY